jgi:hypothetical protein
VATSYEVVRSTTVAAEPARVHALIDDFRAWQRWSPWEDLDPDLQRTYAGPEHGVGAHYAWQGNRKAGRGSMEITGSTPEEVDVKLVFLKPVASTSDVAFLIAPDGTGGATVQWRMRGEQSGIWGVLGRVVSMDRLIGKDFERGLTRLKAAAER